MSTSIAQQLTTAGACVDRLARDHANVAAQMAGNHPRGHGIADPAGTVEWTVVEAAALRRIASQAGRYQNLIECALRALLEADEIRMMAIPTTIATTQATTEARCDGWDDPTCERNGVQNVWISGHNHWLCQRCWDRHRQAKRRAGVEA